MHGHFSNIAKTRSHFNKKNEIGGTLYQISWKKNYYDRLILIYRWLIVFIEGDYYLFIKKISFLILYITNLKKFNIFCESIAREVELIRSAI